MKNVFLTFTLITFTCLLIGAFFNGTFDGSVWNGISQVISTFIISIATLMAVVENFTDKVE